MKLGNKEQQYNVHQQRGLSSEDIKRKISFGTKIVMKTRE